MPLLQLLSQDGVYNLMLLQHGLAPALIQHRTLREGNIEREPRVQHLADVVILLQHDLATVSPLSCCRRTAL